MNTVHNKNYMSIGVSVRTTKSASCNNGIGVRQTNDQREFSEAITARSRQLHIVPFVGLNNKNMTRITLILIICTSIFACGNSSKSGTVAELKGKKTNIVSQIESINCIPENLKLLKNNEYLDTTIYLRNSVSKDSSIMITCDTTLIDFRLEKMLLESKYLPYHKTKGYKSFLLCNKVNEKRLEISFYNLCLETSQAWEVRRFLIENYQIKGLICLPGIVDKFMSPEEYDKEERNVQID